MSVLTSNHSGQVIASRSVAVVYQLSLYVIIRSEPDTGLIDFNHVVFLYYCKLLFVYIWYDLKKTSFKCVVYTVTPSVDYDLSLVPLFISRALMCLSTWVCAVGGRSSVFVSR